MQLTAQEQQQQKLEQKKERTNEISYKMNGNESDEEPLRDEIRQGTYVQLIIND